MENPAKNYVRFTRIQGLIATRMLESKLSKPCFFIASRADVTELMGLRSKLSKRAGVKITSNTFFVRALALAAKKYPVMTGRVDGDELRLADAINVGFAVSSPQGLVVPVIKGADEKTLAEIARQDKLLTEKARSNKLTLEDMEGETIALSNLGAYGIDSFFGIVPPPTSTILAVGNVVRTAVPEASPVRSRRPTSNRVRKIAELSLAVDRRVVNERYAAQFLNFIVEQLEGPQRLV